MQNMWLRKTFHKVAVRRVALIAAGVLLFGAGLVIGQGKVSFTSAAYKSNTELPSKLDYSQVDAVYQALKDNYDGKLTEKQVIDGIKHGLAQSTNDPYTEFFTADETNQFNNDLQGTITGIGAQLALDDDGNVVIVAPLAGSPAEAAGLKAKDVIVAIDGKSTSGMSTNEAVLKIRGEKGSKVTLTVVRNKQQPFDVTITRDTIHVPSVTSKILDGNIGYIHVNQFSDDTDELARKAADDFKAKGVDKVILDLRDNPGGEVSSAVGLSSLWLDSGQTVVQEKHGGTVVEVDRATGDPVLKGDKTVVLINSGSASASEITALALKDQIGARLIGETSYGKGVMQRLIPFSDGSSLKVTIGSWYSPNDTNINKKGIKPDQVVVLTSEDAKAQNDTQLKAAQSWLQQQ